YRRRYYATHPERRRRLSRPVISVGNLAVGGRAKTPLAGSIAAHLAAAGERPAILSRGYARRRAQDGVVVVRDAAGIRADIDRAGDEPLMLARRLDGVAVLTCADRYLAGRVAEHHFGCTVHVLDDGFQHFALHRSIDIVVIGREDLDHARTLPFGDHHPYSAGDVARICRVAREQGADLIVTTEKDLVRLLRFRPFPLSLAWVPLTVRIEPADAFNRWLTASLFNAREAVQ